MDKLFARVEKPLTKLMNICVEADLTDEVTEACEDLSAALKIKGKSEKVAEQKLDAGLAFYEELVQVMYELEGLELDVLDRIPEELNFDLASVASLLAEIEQGLRDEWEKSGLKSQS